MSFSTLFGTGGHQSSNTQTYAASLTYYANVGLGRCPLITGGFTSESSASQIIRVAGNFSTLIWGLDTGFPATLSLTLNQNGAATALGVSFPANTTGTMTDSTDSVTVAATDAVDFAATVGADVEGGYTGSYNCISTRFVCTAQSAQMIAAVGPIDTGVSTMAKFFNFLGALNVGDTTESNAQYECWAGGTWGNMACHVGSYPFNETTTLTNRKNASYGSMALSISPSSTGYFEDTTHSDTVTAGTLLDYALSASASGNNEAIGMDWIGAHFLAVATSTASRCVIGGSQGGQAEIESDTTRYSSLLGGGTVGFGTDRSTGLLPSAFTASNFTNLLTASQLNVGTATLTLLKNGSPSTVATSSPAGATGHFTDSTGTLSFVVGDSIANQIAAAGGYVRWAGAGLVLEG